MSSTHHDIRDFLSRDIASCEAAIAGSDVPTPVRNPPRVGGSSAMIALDRAHSLVTCKREGIAGRPSARGGLRRSQKPRTIEDAVARFGYAFQGSNTKSRPPIDLWNGRMTARWGIFRDEYEAWEVDWAYLPEGTLEGARNDHDYWRATPIGTITYVDRHDLPIEKHVARAKAIVAAGSAFAAVGDVDTGEIHSVRAHGIRPLAAGRRIPEIDWFEFPVLH